MRFAESFINMRLFNYLVHPLQSVKYSGERPLPIETTESSKRIQ